MHICIQKHIAIQSESLRRMGIFSEHFIYQDKIHPLHENGKQNKVPLSKPIADWHIWPLQILIH